MVLDDVECKGNFVGREIFGIYVWRDFSSGGFLWGPYSWWACHVDLLSRFCHGLLWVVSLFLFGLFLRHFFLVLVGVAFSFSFD